MMEVVMTNGATGSISRAKFQSYHHHQQTNIQFFTGRIPFLSPNQQCQSTEGKWKNNDAEQKLEVIGVVGCRL